MRQQLEKANKLDEKIKDIESFILLASENGFWEELVFKKELKLHTNVIPFAREKEKGLELDKDLTLKVIEVLRKEAEVLRKELESLLVKDNEN